MSPHRSACMGRTGRRGRWGQPRASRALIVEVPFARDRLKKACELSPVDSDNTWTTETSSAAGLRPLSPRARRSRASWSTSANSTHDLVEQPCVIGSQTFEDVLHRHRRLPEFSAALVSNDQAGVVRLVDPDLQGLVPVHFVVRPRRWPRRARRRWPPRYVSG